MAKHLIIIAGEASGDLHAANLVRQLKYLEPKIELSGLGGKRMGQAGVDIYYPITELAVVGFIEVLKHYTEFKKVFNLILNKIDRIKPAAVILVDYPGFNLRLAKEIKKRNIKIFYYVSPQIWAWGKKRIHLIKQVVDKMLVVFKFEEDLYKRYGVPCAFVGHPLLDTVKSTVSKEEFLRQFGLEKNKITLSLLPGSRPKEVERLLPIMLDATRIISEKNKNLQVIILKSTSVDKELFDKILKHHRLYARIIEDRTYDGLNVSDFAIVASGTATLEAAIMQVPFVIVYKISLLSYFLLKFMIKIKKIGLVNVVFGKQIIPEFVQFSARPQKIAQNILPTLCDQQKLSRIKQDLAQIRLLLGPKEASRHAAEIILKSL